MFLSNIDKQYISLQQTLKIRENTKCLHEQELKTSGIMKSGSFEKSLKQFFFPINTSIKRGNLKKPSSRVQKWLFDIQNQYQIYPSGNKFLNHKPLSIDMKVLNCIADIFRFCDLFATTQFLRYKDEDQYKTASGGIVSLIILSIFLALFMNTAIQTINKDIITWTSTITNLLSPSPTTLTFGPQNNFIFTVGVMGLNLNDPSVRYFDVEMVQHHYKAGGIELGGKVVPLQPCTKQHFSVNSQLQQSFNTMPAYRWLCSPINYTYELYGKYTSKDMKFLEIALKKCSNSTNSYRPCASDVKMDHLQAAFGQFTFSFFYINPLINPGNKNYLSYYFQDRNYITFTRQLGAYSNGFIQDYNIQTDQSLLPFTQNRIDSGVTIPQLFQNIAYQVTGDNYASFYLLKSSSQTDYTRSFSKIDAFFSYVGGLVGTILGFMLFMNKFSQMSFELDISKKLFRYNQDEKVDFTTFNILTYILYLFYSLGVSCGFCSKWNQMKKAQTCRNEVKKQIDILNIVRRFNKNQKIVNLLLKQLDLRFKKNQELDLLDEIKERRRFFTKNKMKNTNEANNQSKEESQKSQSDEQNKSKEYSPGRPKQDSTLNIHNASLNQFPDNAVFDSNLQSYAFNEQSAKNEPYFAFQPLHKSNQRKDSKDLNQLNDQNRADLSGQMSPRQITVRQGVQKVKNEEKNGQEIKHIPSNFQFVD